MSLLSIILIYYFNLYFELFLSLFAIDSVKKFSKLLTYVSFCVFFTLHVCPYFQQMEIYAEWFYNDRQAAKLAIFQCLLGSFYFSFFLGLRDEASRRIDYVFFIIIQFVFYLSFLVQEFFISYILILIILSYGIFLYFSKKVGFFVVATSAYCIFVLFTFGSFLIF
jgi:hypothetical protein